MPLFIQGLWRQVWFKGGKVGEGDDVGHTEDKTITVLLEGETVIVEV